MTRIGRTRRRKKKASRRSLATAGAVLAGSVIAGLIARRGGDRNVPHVGLYFEDGSMLSLPEGSPQAAPLVELGRETVEAVRTQGR